MDQHPAVLDTMIAAMQAQAAGSGDMRDIPGYRHLHQSSTLSLPTCTGARRHWLHTGMIVVSDALNRASMMAGNCNSPSNRAINLQQTAQDRQRLRCRSRARFGSVKT